MPLHLPNNKREKQIQWQGFYLGFLFFCALIIIAIWFN